MKGQNKIITDLNSALDVAKDANTLTEWLDLKGALAFLDCDAHAESLIINLSAGHFYLVSALVPRDRTKGETNDDLLGWSYDPSSTWGICSSRENVWIEEPFSGHRSKSLEGGEPIIILRSFDGVPEYRTYFELSQRFAHVMGLHHLPERRAWCRLDGHGDLEDVVRIIEIPAKADGHSGRIILCDRDTLARYAELAEMTFVQLFDITYFEPGNFTSWNNNTFEDRTFNSLRYRYGRGSRAAFARGFKIVPLKASRSEIASETWGQPSDKKYELFITLDRKHDRIVETSCDPKEVDSYFVETGKPWQISPVFFRPEVLLKYKADREKYQLSHRTISCRGSWSLKTFDVNEEGQVHTYLWYLSDLPHSEQLHWKQYNEEPKGPISKRAHQTDIVGDFWNGYDPLLSLQRKLEHLREHKSPWWSLRSDNLIDKVYYPVTSSPDEWADELLNLSQLVVEGFETKFLRAQSGEIDPRLQSLALLEKSMVKIGFEVSHAKKIVQPLRDLQDLRNKTKGHAGGSDAKMLRAAALKAHGSLQAHFRDLVQQCDESFDKLIKAFDFHKAATSV